MSHDMESNRHNATAELTPELKQLLARIRNGQALQLTENGVVVAKLERVPVHEGEVALENALAGMREFRAGLDRFLSDDEVVAAISKGRK